MVAAASSFQEELTFPKARISITGDCNLECFFCKPLGNDAYKTGVKWTLTPSDATRFIRNLGEKGISKVEIAGCEPLLRKDAASFVKSIASIKTIKEVCLKTNGTFLKNYADALKKAGLKKLEVTLTSLNFMKYQKITGKDNLYRVLDGIEKAERVKFNDLILNILVMSGVNCDELIDFAMLTKTKNIHIRFLEYHPVATSPLEDNQLNMSILYIKRAIDEFQKLFPINDGIETDGITKFQFADGIGTVSFLNQTDIEKLRAEPLIALNSMGNLQNSGQPRKVVNVLKDLRKDSKSEALSKLFDSQISAALNKTKAKLKEQSDTKSKVKAKTKATPKKRKTTSTRISVSKPASRHKSARA